MTPLQSAATAAALFLAAPSAAVAQATVSASDTPPPVWSDRDEVRAIVAEMLADTESRSSLLENNSAAGYDGAFFLADPGGNFRLNVKGFTQFRYVFNWRDDGSTTGASAGDDYQSNFSLARTELFLDGHVISPSLFYQVNFSFYETESATNTTRQGDFELERAFVGYRFNNNWFVRWGQFKPAFLREFNVRDTKQLAVERSVTNAFFHQGFTQGLELGYEGEDFRFQASFNDGFNAANTAFNDRRRYILGNAMNPQLPLLPYPKHDVGGSEYAFTGRAELKILGTWRQFDDFTGFPKDRHGLMFGGAFHYEGGENDNPTLANGLPSEYEYVSWTFDVSLEGPGYNVFAAVIGGHTNVDGLGGTGVNTDFDDYGIVAQAGWFIPGTDWEIFGRWDAIFGDDSRSGDTDFNTVTIGTNWYWSGHAAKFTTDFVWFLDDASALGGALPALTRPGAGNNGLNGLLGDSDEGEFALRFQFQLMF